MPNTEEKIKLWLRWEVWIIAIVIGSILWFTTQFEAIRTNQAVMDQKLDTLISWTGKHESETVTMKQELNSTFSYIFEKLGSKYIKQ